MALHLLPPDLDSYEAAVDEVIAACDGDLRGALTALIIANEYLERDLQEALASAAAPSIADAGDAGTTVNWIEVRRLVAPRQTSKQATPKMSTADLKTCRPMLPKPLALQS